ncbi:MAG: hypothetical protein ACTSYM_04930 [Candidatus Baldrarchaeia archaeon]
MEVVKKIPVDKRKNLMTPLIDILLRSNNVTKLSSSTANLILHYWQHDELTSDKGFQKLLEAAYAIEPEQTTELLSNASLNDVAEELKKQV